MPSWTCRSRRSSRAGERRFQSSKESLASAQGPARGRRVCSFIGVGYLGLFGLWLMEGPWSVQGCLLGGEGGGSWTCRRRRGSRAGEGDVGLPRSPWRVEVSLVSGWTDKNRGGS